MYVSPVRPEASSADAPEELAERLAHLIADYVTATLPAPDVGAFA